MQIKYTMIAIVITMFTMINYGTSFAANTITINYVEKITFKDNTSHYEGDVNGVAIVFNPIDCNGLTEDGYINQSVKAEVINYPIGNMGKGSMMINNCTFWYMYSDYEGVTVTILDTYTYDNTLWYTALINGNILINLQRFDSDTLTYGTYYGTITLWCNMQDDKMGLIIIDGKEHEYFNRTKVNTYLPLVSN